MAEKHSNKKVTSRKQGIGITVAMGAIAGTIALACPECPMIDIVYEPEPPTETTGAVPQDVPRDPNPSVCPGAVWCPCATDDECEGPLACAPSNLCQESCSTVNDCSVQLPGLVCVSQTCAIACQSDIDCQLAGLGFTICIDFGAAGRYCGIQD